jgi:transposase-like protein
LSVARGKAHGVELRAAVLTSLLSGSSVQETARVNKLSERTVRLWWTQAGLNPNAGAIGKEVALETKADLGELVSEYLSETLTTLSVQSRHFRDRAWLAEQRAGELAILHGVLNDKAVRIIAALRPDHDALERPGPAELPPPPVSGGAVERADD